MVGGAKTVWLIRHGQSEGNIGLPALGGTTPLTELGRRQAERVATAFTGPPDLIVASPFLRARQTAQPTVDRFPAVPLRQWPVQEFHCLPAAVTDLPVTSAALEPHERAYWQRADPHERHPGRESFADLLDRAGALLDRLDAAPDRFVAVFSHGTFLCAVLWTVLVATPEPTAAGMRAFRTFHDAWLTPNGVIFELRYPGPRLLGGRVAHLAAAPD
jgi:broad specificity phosphatase PhoE